jgi:hypothetical protein
MPAESAEISKFLMANFAFVACQRKLSMLSSQVDAKVFFQPEGLRTNWTFEAFLRRFLVISIDVERKTSTDIEFLPTKTACVLNTFQVFVYISLVFFLCHFIRFLVLCHVVNIQVYHYLERSRTHLTLELFFIFTRMIVVEMPHQARLVQEQITTNLTEVIQKVFVVSFLVDLQQFFSDENSVAFFTSENIFKHFQTHRILIEKELMKFDTCYNVKRQKTTKVCSR